MFAQFTIKDRVTLVFGENQQPQLLLTCGRSQARVSLFGAQVLEFKSAGENWLWLSPATPAPGKAIRGGIPVCWPWFGAHPDKSRLPAHGFARTRRWDIRRTYADDECTELTLGMKPSTETRALWPYDFDLELHIRLTRTLTLTLKTHNIDSEPMRITEALHSYFAVNEVNGCELKGLSGCDYRDKILDFAEGHESASILRAAPPIDRVFRHKGDLVLTDATSRLLINKRNSASTIVWNPGEAKAARMDDIGSHGSHRFLCVEAGNALEDAITIEPGASHELSMELIPG